MSEFAKCPRCGTEHNPFQSCSDIVTHDPDSVPNTVPNRVKVWKAKNKVKVNEYQRLYMQKKRSVGKNSFSVN